VCGLSHIEASMQHACTKTFNHFLPLVFGSSHVCTRLLIYCGSLHEGLREHTYLRHVLQCGLSHNSRTEVHAHQAHFQRISALISAHGCELPFTHDIRACAVSCCCHGP
jgi:hypothetical protein